MKQRPTTEEEFKTIMNNCRDLFIKKMHDYGTAWRSMRPTSITDHINIKSNVTRISDR